MPLNLKRMKKFFAVLTASALLCLSGSVFASANSEGVAVKFPEFNDATYLGGPKLKSDSLKGKVVFFEYWGINCPPCLASMPHLQELYKKHGKDGRFVVVGSHMQGRSPRIAQFLDSKGITFSIYQGAVIEEARPLVGLPYAVLIGADGKVVSSGSPFNIFKLVEKELRKTAGGLPLFPDFEAKKYKSVVKSLVYDGANLEGKIKPLRAKKDDPEAVELCKLFADWRKGEMLIVKDLLKDDPLAGIKAYEKLKVSLPDSTKVFADRVAKLKKDKDLNAIEELDKKVVSLEERKAKGRKVTKQSLDPIRDDLAPYLESERSFVKNYATALNVRLLALEKN